MVRMRDATAVLAVAIMVLSVFPVIVSDGGSEAAGKDLNGLLIYELQPKNENDGFALKNYGTSTINLEGYYIKDGNGSVKTYTFDSKSIAVNGVAVFVKKTIGADDFSTSSAGRNVYKVADNKVNLDNSGDALFLYDPSDNLVDAVCYGSYTTTTGWSGPAVDLGFKEDVIRRCEATDTDSYFDWVAVGKGYSARSFSETVSYDADVKAFTFPESGGKPILEALKEATTSIDISIYMITSGYIGAVLKDRVNSGVVVRVIMENKPLGYDQSDYAWILKDVNDSPNGEVKFIGGGSYDRYSYVHNKYAVIDGEKVVITSENWTAGNISTDTSKANRGWGAVVESADFATYMGTFFTNDWTFSDDFASFDSKYVDQGKTLPTMSTVNSYISSTDDKSQTFSGVKASIYMSPDNTFKALQYLIDNATDRVYTEQMDLGASYGDLAKLSPLSALSKAADRGVDARFMITASGNNELVDKLNTTTNIKAAGMGTSGYATMHNKGVIIDDTVWVSSVNWTDNAFMNNRECGLYLQSAALATYYANAYMGDWEKNYKLSDTLTVIPDLSAGTFSVKNPTSTYKWIAYDKDGKVIKEAEGNTFTVDNINDIGSVKVTDAENHTGRYILSGTVTNEPTSKNELPVKEIATYGGIGAAILAALLIIWKFVLGKGKKKAKKTVKKTVNKAAKSTKKK